MQSEQGLAQWDEIPAEQVNEWNRRLSGTAASYRQYPYWSEAYKHSHFRPCYLTYGPPERPSAYVCVVTVNIPKFKIGLIQGGPVNLRADEIDTAALRSLAQWARRRGYVFLRFTHSDQHLLDCVAAVGGTEQGEAFPFYRDPRNKLLVTQLDSDADMLASFQSVARYEIRAAERAGYEIRVSEQPQELAETWPMFEALARRKGFQLSARPRAAWLDLFRLARPHQYARLYTAHHDGRLVQAIFVIKYGATAEYMLGALNVQELKGRVSPSCLIHWWAMRDFYRLGCQVYNLGGPGDMKRNYVYQFKRKFRPDLKINPPPITLVLNPGRYRLWSALALRTFLPWRARMRRLIAHAQLQLQQ